MKVCNSMVDELLRCSPKVFESAWQQAIQSAEAPERPWKSAEPSSPLPLRFHFKQPPSTSISSLFWTTSALVQHETASTAYMRAWMELVMEQW